MKQDPSGIDAVLKLAASQAEAGGCGSIMPAHILMALAVLSDSNKAANDGGSGSLHREFERLGIDTLVFRQGLRDLLKEAAAGTSNDVVHHLVRLENLLATAAGLARKSRMPMAPVHLLQAVFLGGERRETPVPDGQDDEIPYEL